MLQSNVLTNATVKFRLSITEVLTLS